MYCREYQLTQPGCYSQGSTPHLRVNEEPIGKSLSYGASPINGFDGIDTILFGHYQQLSKASHSNICLAAAGKNAVGVEAELLRIALAKSQHGMIPSQDMINNCVQS